jgi:hypothetical protein
MDRAWVFSLLARQAGLDVVMLAAAPEPGKRKRDLLPALLHNERLYLFDPQMGLPVAGAGGRGVATLSEVAADDGLLRQMDAGAEHPYRFTSADFARVIAQVEASPYYVSRRMSAIAERLAGNDRIVLTARLSEIKAKLSACDPPLAGIEIWDIAAKTQVRKEQLIANREMTTSERAAAALRRHDLIWHFSIYAFRPRLYRARVTHFRDDVMQRIESQSGKLEPVYSSDNDPRVQYHRCRPRDDVLRTLEIDASLRFFANLAKVHASYWRGVLAFEDGDYDVAIEYLNERTLGAKPAIPISDRIRFIPFTGGARYHLGRSYEAKARSLAALRDAVPAISIASPYPLPTTQILLRHELQRNIDALAEQALRWYEADTTAQRHGNLIRYRRFLQDVQARTGE